MDEAGPNEDVIRTGLRAFSEGRFEDSAGTLHPDVEWHIAFQLPDLPPDRRVVRGREAVLDLWRQFTGVFDEMVFEPEEILHDVGGTVITRVHVRGVGGESGIVVDQTLFYVMTIGDEGLLERIVPYETLADAAEAAGVEL
jgi:ketosteroid isomerase-like protein